MNLFTPLFTNISRPLFAPLFSGGPEYLALMEGGFFALQDGGKLELH